MRYLLKNRITIVFIFSIFIFISCSKDSDDPNASEITVTTSDFSITIDENPANGQVIGTVQGSTNEGTVGFSIIEQTPANSFFIDAGSGQLKVVDESLFDFETNPIFTGTVKVSSGTVSKKALITIKLTDVEEENIYEGTIELKSQQEVNDFGSYNYTRIAGDMIIGSIEEFVYSDITDLSPLQSIKKVDYSLIISRNPNLEFIAPLSINEVGSQLAVIENPKLTTLEGLENITSLPFGLFLFGNDQLSNVSQLGSLTEMGSLALFNCPLLPNLAFLSNINSLGSIEIYSCNSLTNLDGLSNLRSLVGDYPQLEISRNLSLKNLNGLQNLNASVIHLQIDGNTALTSLHGIENIIPTQDLKISRNHSLQNLEGLENITAVSNVDIIDNPLLVNLNGLQNLNAVYSNFSVADNDALYSLDGLENLEECFFLTAVNNDSLSNFCALQNLVLENNNVYLEIRDNAYNPTKQDIIDGNCSL